MRKRWLAIIIVSMCIMFATACGATDISDTETESAVETEVVSKIETESLTEAESESKEESEFKEEVLPTETVEEEFDASIPEEFVDFSKFIGKKIDVLGIEIDEDNPSGFYRDGDYTATFYGHTGKVSFQYLINDRDFSIWTVFLNLENDPLTEVDYSKIYDGIIGQYGDTVVESTMSYKVSGATDYEFTLPKIGKLGVCMISWTTDKCMEFYDRRNNNKAEEIESDAPMIDDDELVSQLKGTYTLGDTRYIISDSRITAYYKMNDRTYSYSFEIIDFNNERCLFVDYKNSGGSVFVLRDGEAYTHMVDIGKDGSLTLYKSGVTGYDDSIYRHLTRISSECLELKKPAIGMTADEVRESTWGEPTKINKTTYSFGVREQWVYGNGKYIYLDDGVVSAIQE